MQTGFYPLYNTTPGFGPVTTPYGISPFAGYGQQTWPTVNTFGGIPQTIGNPLVNTIHPFMGVNNPFVGNPFVVNPLVASQFATNPLVSHPFVTAAALQNPVVAQALQSQIAGCATPWQTPFNQVPFSGVNPVAPFVNQPISQIAPWLTNPLASSIMNPIAGISSLVGNPFVTPLQTAQIQSLCGLTGCTPFTGGYGMGTIPGMTGVNPITGIHPLQGINSFVGQNVVNPFVASQFGLNSVSPFGVTNPISSFPGLNLLSQIHPMIQSMFGGAVSPLASISGQTNPFVSGITGWNNVTQPWNPIAQTLASNPALCNTLGATGQINPIVAAMCCGCDPITASCLCNPALASILGQQGCGFGGGNWFNGIGTGLGTGLYGSPVAGRFNGSACSPFGCY